MLTTATNTRSFLSPQGLARIDATQAKAIFSQGEEAVVFALLELAKQLSEARFSSVNPATPSGMIPTDQKPPAKNRKKTPGATKHTINRDWCSHCNKKVEPPVTDALPGSRLGLRVLVLSAWLHFALRNTPGQIVEVFNFHLQMKITPGGLIKMWYRLKEWLFEWYQQIHTEANKEQTAKPY